MTYQRHWLLSWGGTLATTQDIWSNSVRMTNDAIASGDTIGDSDMEGLLSGFLLDLRELFANAAAGISNSVRCTWVKFNEIGPDGKYVDTDTTHARYLTGTTGDLATIQGTGVSACPTFQAMCITTTTARQRGPASKGRLFVPMPAAAVGANGRWSAAQTQTAATAWAQFFTDLGDEEGIDNTAIAPAVVSNVGSPGPVERITGVRVGDVPDYISRRKNAMVEVYSLATVSTA